MTHLQAIMTSRLKKLVSDDKFDRHMKRARVTTTNSCKAIFDRQTEKSVLRQERIKNIHPSIY